MKRFVLATLLVILAGPATAADRLPDRIDYTIYVRGTEAGYSRMTVTYEGDAVIVETDTRVEIDGFALNYASKTTADAKTFFVRSFEWSGVKAGKDTGGKVTVDGTSVAGTFRSGEYEQQGGREGRHDHLLFLEDYVMSHEVLIARAHTTLGAAETAYDLFQPVSFSMNSISVVSASEIAFESSIKEAICTKLILTVQGGSGFASYFDPGRGLPVYLAFPGSNTEVFLDEFFGGEPVSRYRE